MRRLIGALIVLLVVLTGIGVAAHVLIDRSALREDVIASVKRQTGRDLTLGSFSVQVFPWPSFAARDVNLSNVAGHDPSPMFHANEVRATLALTPLIWREIRLEHVVVDGGAIALRRTSDDGANWHFTPTEPSAAPTTAPSGAHRVPARWRVELGSATIADTDISWRDETNGHGGHFTIDRLELDGLRSPSPYLDLHGHRGGAPFTLTGHIGPLSVFSGSNVPWAVSLGATLGADVAHHDWVNIDGQISDPRNLRGIAGTVRGELGQLRDLQGIFPNANLPAIDGIGGEIGLYDISAHGNDWRAAVVGSGLNHIHLHIGHLPVWQGFRAQSVSIDAETLSAPLTIAGDLTWRTRLWHVQSQFGTLSQALASLHSRLQTGLPVTVAFREPGQGGLSTRDQHDPNQDATFSLRGVIGANTTQLDITGQAQGLVVQAATLHDAALKASVTVQNLRDVQIHGLSLTSREANLAGEVAFTLAHNPNIHATIDMAHLDMDALHGLWNAQPLPAATSTVATATPLTAPDAASVQPSVAPPHNWSSILRQRDGDVKLHVGTLRFNGQDYSDLEARALLTNGDLKLDPLSAHGAGAALSGTVEYDASRNPAALSVHFAPVLLPATLAETQVGLPFFLRGPLEAVGELSAQGEDRAALAASVSGHLGLSMVGGTVDGRLLGQLIGRDAQAMLGHGDISLRCLGLHMQIDQGRASLDTIGMQAGPVDATGSGTFAFATQEMALHLVPHIGFGGTGASTPVMVSGTLNAPIVQQEAGHDGRFELTIGGAAPDTCGPALTAAREGLAGDPPPEAKHHSRASDFLHALGILH